MGGLDSIPGQSKGMAFYSKIKIKVHKRYYPGTGVQWMKQLKTREAG